MRSRSHVPASRLRSIARACGLGLAGLVAAGILWLLAPRTPWPADAYREAAGRLVRVETVDRTHEADWTREELLLTGESGLSVRALVRRPTDAAGPLPVGVLLGGLRTGARAVDHVPVDGPPMIWASVDYPYRTPRSLPWTEIPGELRRASTGVREAVASVLLLLDHLHASGVIDPARTLVVGGSLGAYVALLVAAADDRVDAAATLHAGAPLEEVVAANLRIHGAVPRRVAAAALGPWLDRVEPAEHAARIAPRPLLVVGSPEDRRIPPDTVERLYAAAGEPKRLRWVETPHEVMGDEELTSRLARTVWTWLDDLGWRAPPPGPP